jgi:hypothetical protein
MNKPRHFLADMIDREIAAGARIGSLPGSLPHESRDYFITTCGTAFGETVLTSAGMQYARERLA